MTLAEHLASRPLTTAAELAKFDEWPLRATATRDAANRGEIPSLHIGRRLFIPTGPLRQFLGIVPAPDAEDVELHPNDDDDPLAGGVRVVS